MIRFIISFVAVLAAVYGWNLASDRYFMVLEKLLKGPIALQFCLIPTLASASIALLIHTLRPRRLFDSPTSQSLKPILLGIVTGLTSLGSVLLALSPLGINANDTLILISSSVGVTFIILMLFGGCRQCGHCRRCGYDIRMSLEFGRCPDCGMAI